MQKDLLAAVVVGLMALAACSDSSDHVNTPEWVVSDTPLVSIGELEGETAYLFQSIIDAELLSDGRVVIADGGLSVIRVFDSAGALLSELGGSGEGPGEFQTLRSIWTQGDTLVAWDSESRRLSYFTLPSTLSRVVSLERSPEASGVGSLDAAVGALPSGIVVIASLGFGSTGDGSTGEVSADRLSLETFGADGAHLGRVLDGTGLIRFRVGERGSAPVPFSPLPHFDTHGSRIYYADGSSPTVTAWSAGATRVIQLPGIAHDIDAAWAGLVEGVQEDGREFFAGIISEAPRPDSLPQLAGLLVGDDGQIWTKPYEPMADALWLAGADNYWGTWRVVDDAGAVVATVSLPRGFRPLSVADDLVLGVGVDALGVERVQVRRVEK